MSLIANGLVCPGWLPSFIIDLVEAEIVDNLFSSFVQAVVYALSQAPCL